MATTQVTDKQIQLFQLMNQGTAFTNPLRSGSSALTSNLSASTNHLSLLNTNLTNPTYSQQLSAAGLTSSLITSMSGKVTSAGSTISTLTTYGDKAVEEFSQRLRIADNYDSITKKFTGVDNGCSSTSGVMSVVQSYGQAAMDTYNSVISSANSAISALNTAIKNGVSNIGVLAANAAAAINNAINKATEFANRVTQMIADETAEIARQTAASVHAWLSGVLPDWFDDPCKGDILNKVSTPALKNAATT